jgi:succinyl-diaminopimelate desuccinylase
MSDENVFQRKCCGDGVSIEELERRIDEQLEADWPVLLDDLRSLIQIESTEDLTQAKPGAPFGPGPERALDRISEIMRERLGDGASIDGYVACADIPGISGRQIGIIGHVDVVPAGPGWHFPPYDLTLRDGYLIGRGTSDDKGPLLAALWAANFWAGAAGKADDDEAVVLPLRHSIRVIAGANEETNMADVAYYQRHFPDPDFLFTPDAEFPLGYGEAGLFQGTLKSAPINGGLIVEIAGGAATNAVPGEAYAVACLADGAGADEPGGMPQPTDKVSVIALGDGLVRIEARGKSAHASTPELGESAIFLLVGYLLDNGLCSAAERPFLHLLRKVLAETDGSGAGIQATDEDFGSLTCVGGVIGMKDGCITQSVDCRYPANTSGDAIAAKLSALAETIGASFKVDIDKPPFLMNPEGAAVKALMTAYNRVTGKQAAPFTMKGGTYARKFAHAVSFGPEELDERRPDWVGTMHGPDEGISEASLKRAAKIYALAIGLLMRVDL